MKIGNNQYENLRALALHDVSGMLEWMHDESIASIFQFDFMSVTEEQALSFIKSSWEITESFHFAIVDKHDEYMGTISLKNIDTQNRNAEYAISTRKCSHGSGLASRATVDILNYAFDELRLNKVYLNVSSENKRANAFYRKFGFMHEGTSKQHFFIDGKYVNVDWYGITIDEFRQLE